MIDEQKDIIVANPMYDAVFKALMEDRDYARYFVEAIINEEIVEIDFAKNDYTYYVQEDPENKSKKIKIVRMDFVATIRNKDGKEKKVLIEIQQSLNPIDVFRFRSYIAKHYAAHENIIKQEKIVIKKDKVTIKEQVVDVRSIIAIYMLGFEIEDAPHLVSKFVFKGTDIIDGGEVFTQHPIVTDLAHEAYYIQVPRITPERYMDWKKCSRLLKLLSLFEQNYFVDKKYLKKYVYRITENETDKILKKMIATLEQIAADPYARRVMEEEEFMTMNIDFWKQTIVNKDSIIAAVSAELAQRDKELVQRDKELEEYRRRYGKLNGATN